MRRILTSLFVLLGCSQAPAYAQVEEMAKQAMPVTVDRQLFNAVVHYLNTQKVATSYQCAANSSHWFCQAAHLQAAMQQQLEKALKEIESE